jgi:hypothetical protein
VSASPYVSAWNTMKSWFAEDLTNGAQTKWLMTQLGRSVAAGSYDVGYDSIRDAHRQLDQAGSCLLVRSTCDYTIINPDGSGGVSSHYGGVDQTKSGVAWAHGILYLLGQRSTYGGPRLTYATLDATRKIIDVYVTHKSGSDYMPTSAIPGFSVTDQIGAMTISSAVRQSPSVVRLTLSAAATGTTTVKYLSGKNPAGPSGLLVDNGSTVYPVEPVPSPGLLASDAANGFLPLWRRRNRR